MIKQFERVKTITKKIKFDLSLPFKNRKLRPIFKLVNTPFPSNLYPIRTYSENGEVLFKDDGLSGIVILNMSSVRKDFCTKIPFNFA